MAPQALTLQLAQRLADALVACADALAEELDDHYWLRATSPREMASWTTAMEPVFEARAALQQWLEGAA